MMLLPLISKIDGLNITQSEIVISWLIIVIVLYCSSSKVPYID